MQDRIRILHLEDNLRDAELIESALEGQGVNASWTRVETPEALVKALQKEPFNLIISDFSFPTFNGLDALEAAKNSRPNVPFIFVSGTIGEERAVEAMRRGATDYVLKDKIFRLGDVVKRALAETALRVQRGLAEDRQRESEHLFKILLESTPDMVLLVDRDLRYLYANPEAARILNTSVEEIVGKSISEVLPADVVDRTVADLRHVFETGQPYFRDFSEEISIGDISVELRMVPIKNKKGEITSVLAITHDVTERKKAERILRESEEKFRTLAEGSPNIIFISRDGRVLYENGRSLDILGYPKDELLDSAFPVQSIVAPEFMEKWTLHVSRTAGGEQLPPAEYEGLRKDGRRAQFVFNAALISYEGSPALLGVVTDISELKRVERENAKIQDRLHQAEKMEAIGSLAGGVAHDFNNILMVILSYSGFLLDKLPVGGPLRREVEQIKKAGNRAAELTNHLLAFSRKQAVVPREIDLNEAVRNLHKMIGRLIGENIRLTLDLQPDIGSILCDPSQFDQILINLVVNSRDAMPGGGMITVETRGVELDTRNLVGNPDATPGHYIRVAVIDTGSGIPAEIIGKIFDPFFTTKPKGKGTGLGLSMVYGSIKQNKGHLNVESTPGAGTTFYLYFKQIESSGVKSSASAADAELNLEGFTILLVEDDESVREAIKIMLEKSGCATIEASNGVEAFRVFQEKSPLIDVVLTDVIMPQMGGAELGKRLREIKRDVKIIYGTGYIDDVSELVEALGETPIIISKPYERTDLVRKIRSLLGDKNGRRSESDDPHR